MGQRQCLEMEQEGAFRSPLSAEEAGFGDQMDLPGQDTGALRKIKVARVRGWANSDTFTHDSETSSQNTRHTLSALAALSLAFRTR